jgi:uroporphyrinogen decarboxylase
MNGKQRVEAALKGERPDAVPVMLHNFMMAAAEARISMAEFRSDPRALARAFIEAVERYGYDAILVDVDTVTLAGAVGVPVDLPDNHPARSHKGCLTSLSEVDALEPVDISNNERVSVWLEGTRLLRQYFGDEIFIRGNCDQAPFSLASMMRSTQAWMLDLVEPRNGEQIHKLLTFCTDITKQFISLMSQTGADMVSNGDSVAGPEIIPPSMYKEFALPYERELVDEAHRQGLPYALHICGNTEAILPDMSRSGADCLELDFKTDTKMACETLKDEVTFIGNIDPSGVLALGDPELVRTTTAELLQVFAGTNRFILNSGCALPASTPSENVQAMMLVARQR